MLNKIKFLFIIFLLLFISLLAYNLYLLNLANKFFNQNNFILAEKYYNKLLFKNFYLKNYALQLVVIYEQEGNFKKAIKVLLKFPQNTQQYYEHLCTNFYLLNDLPQAINCQQKLTQNYFNEKNLRYLAILYFENDNLKLAQDLLSKNNFTDLELKKIKNIIKEELKIKPQQKIIKKENFNLYYFSPYDEVYAKEILNYLVKESKKLKFIFADFKKLALRIKLVNDESFTAITGENSKDKLAATINNKLFIRSPRYSPLKPEINSTVTHEFIHLLIHFLTKKKPPTWVNEGLAEYFSKDVLPAVTLEYFKQRINENSLLSINQLQNWNFNNSLDLSLAYIQSYTMIEFFIDKFSFTTLKDLLIKQQISHNFSETFFATTKISLTEFLKEWLAFVKKKYS